MAPPGGYIRLRGAIEINVFLSHFSGPGAHIAALGRYIMAPLGRYIIASGALRWLYEAV